MEIVYTPLITVPGMCPCVTHKLSENTTFFHKPISTITHIGEEQNYRTANHNLCSQLKKNVYPPQLMIGGRKSQTKWRIDEFGEL